MEKSIPGECARCGGPLVVGPYNRATKSRQVRCIRCGNTWEYNPYLPVWRR